MDALVECITLDCSRASELVLLVLVSGRAASEVRRRLVDGLLGDEREQTALGVQLVQQVRAANVLRGRAAGISRAIDDLVCVTLNTRANVRCR